MVELTHVSWNNCIKHNLSIVNMYIYISHYIRMCTVYIISTLHFILCLFCSTVTVKVLFFVVYCKPCTRFCFFFCTQVISVSCFLVIWILPSCEECWESKLIADLCDLNFLRGLRPSSYILPVCPYWVSFSAQRKRNKEEVRGLTLWDVELQFATAGTSTHTNDEGN